MKFEKSSPKATLSIWLIIGVAFLLVWAVEPLGLWFYHLFHHHSHP